MRLVILGRVQRVGFRGFVQREAKARGLTGRVRNRVDGAVEVVAEGPREELERLVVAARRGPDGARVDDVEVEWSEGPARHHDFRIDRSC